jgi:metallo-beta-lactamase class B
MAFSLRPTTNDFRYANDFVYPGVKVDRILRDGDVVRLGEVSLTAHLTPGHTRDATTWVTSVVDNGKLYTVVFPDGAGFNPFFRVAKNPSYPGSADDYRRTHRFLEMLKPDIWLAQHNEYYDLEGKRKRAETEGVAAWKTEAVLVGPLSCRCEAGMRDQGSCFRAVAAPAPKALPLCVTSVG